jgi:hypothetical protein
VLISEFEDMIKIEQKENDKMTLRVEKLKS